MQTLEDFIAALRPFLADDVDIKLQKMYNHEFIVLTDSEAQLCFATECDDEENSWVSFKHYLLEGVENV